MIDTDNPKWIGYETHSFAGINEDGEPKWVPRRFYRCSVGTAVQTPYCPYCGT